MMKDTDLTKQDIRKLAPNLVLSTIGTWGYDLTFNMQENLYGRFNRLAGITEKLGQVINMRPDFLTSFSAPLALMQLTQAISLLGQIQAEKFNNPKRELLFRAGKYIAPIAVALLFVGYELSGAHVNGAKYVDNSTADNLATMAALGISMTTALVSERRRHSSENK